MKRNQIYLVAGIDTGIGKTIVTGLLARALLARGLRATTVKMVQTGNDGFSEDVELHRRLMGIGPTPEDQEGLSAPQIFRFPSSPKLAAELENRCVDLDAIARAVDEVAARYDATFVEAAGGLHVPLTEEMLTIDFVAQRKWPVLLVTCGRLGSLNHTLASLEALHAREIPVAGVLYNYYPNVEPAIDRDTPEMTRAYLARLGYRPLVCRIPEVTDLSHPPLLDIPELFN